METFLKFAFEYPVLEKHFHWSIDILRNKNLICIWSYTDSDTNALMSEKLKKKLHLKFTFLKYKISMSHFKQRKKKLYFVCVFVCVWLCAVAYKIYGTFEAKTFCEANLKCVLMHQEEGFQK